MKLNYFGGCSFLGPVSDGIVVRLKNAVGNSEWYLLPHDALVASPVILGITLTFIDLHRRADQIRVGDLMDGIEVTEVIKGV